MPSSLLRRGTLVPNADNSGLVWIGNPYELAICSGTLLANDWVLMTRIIGYLAALAKRSRGQVGARPLSLVDPTRRPEKLKKSPAPFVHAATKAARLAFREMYALFVAAYREAADKLRKGNRAALFPIGSFPPGQPFVMT